MRHHFGLERFGVTAWVGAAEGLRSERKVEAALDKILEGRTAIIVAHRLTTAMRADRVVVVDHGQVVEQGTHDELVSRGGSYASMYEVWAEHSLHDAVA